MQGIQELTVLSYIAPCTPANVEYQYSCGTGIAFVSWDDTLSRKSFYVHAHSGNHSVSCSTSQGTDCSLPSLECSRRYTVEVITVADNCNSSVPGVTHIQTGKSSRVYTLCFTERRISMCSFFSFLNFK